MKISDDPVCWFAGERSKCFRMLTGLGNGPGMISLKIMGDTLECSSEDALGLAMRLLSAVKLAGDR